jgi:hypothetical protein
MDSLKKINMTDINKNRKGHDISGTIAGFAVFFFCIQIEFIDYVLQDVHKERELKKKDLI